MKRLEETEPALSSNIKVIIALEFENQLYIAFLELNLEYIKKKNIIKI